jgi:hypothetical protein
MRAQEMAQARDAYQSGATGIRNLDYTGAQQATQSAGTANEMARTAANMQQVQAQMEMDQRRLNQSNQQFYENMGFNVNQAALNAGMGMSSMVQNQGQFNQQMDMQQQQQTNQMIAAGMGAGATFGAGAMTRRASGGPVAPGQPVLVGEQGPEVIVPAQPGTVLPATHPASQHAAQKNMSMADVARLRQQADEIERGLKKQLAAGPSVRPASGNRTLSIAPVVIDDAPELPYGGMSTRPAAQPDMSVQPPERLWGGREDPYTADPYYVPLDHAQPTWGGLLSGGREDPYSMGDVAMRRAS